MGRGEKLDRFWSKVQVLGPDACWTFQGGISSCGYGIFWLDGKSVLAHRFAYEYAHGPTKLKVRHKCDNKLCVNPKHLEEGTPKQNSQDMVLRGRSLVGERNHRAKLSSDDVRYILQSSESNVELAKRYGVSRQKVWQIRKGQCWKHMMMTA